MALGGAGSQQARDANEWYWKMRFGHPLVDEVRTREFFADVWSPKDLSKAEEEALTASDLPVLALSESAKARQIAASHPHTAAEVLDRLSCDTSPDVRRAVGHNDSTPGTTLAKMQRDFLKRAGDRGKQNEEISWYRLKWLWMEVDDADFPVDYTQALEIIDLHRGHTVDDRLRLAKKNGLPTEVRRWLAGGQQLDGSVAALLVDDRTLEVREALAGNYPDDWDASVFERLAVDKAAEVRAALAARGGPPAALLAQLSRDQDPDVRIAAAGRAHLPHDSLLRLLEDEDLEVREQVVLHGSLTYEELKQLDSQDDNRPFLHAKLKHQDYGARWGDEHLYGIGDDDVWALARQRAEAEAAKSKEFLRDLAHSPHPSTRATVAQNTGTPEDVLELLANDPESDVRNAVYEALGTDSTDNYGIYREPPVWWYRRDELDVAGLLKSGNPRVRALIARRSDHVGRNRLHSLVCDEDARVRAAAATNPHIAFSDLVALCDDPDETVQRAAANEIGRGLQEYELSESGRHEPNWLIEARRLPQPLKEMVEATVKNSRFDHRSRWLHVGRQSWTGWSPDVDLESLATVDNVDARAAIAAYSGRSEKGWSSYPPVGPKVLQRLAQDPDAHVRRAAFSNTSRSAAELARGQNTPPEVLRGYSTSPSEAIRAAVASNPSAP